MPDSAPAAMWRALMTADPAGKTAAAAEAAALAETLGAWPPFGEWPEAPPMPARPERPTLAAPRDVPRRRLGSQSGRAALLHALAHIEFNAIDLAFDLALRFASQVDEVGLDGQAFAADWLRIGGEECRHFNMLNEHLHKMDSSYGALPAHAGLWDAAVSTRDCVLARLAVAHLILEARGLDVTPGLAARLERVGDAASAAIIMRIYTDEIRHVACAARWFHALADATGRAPKAVFQEFARTRFRGSLRPPFNDVARGQAGLAREFYSELVTAPLDGSDSAPSA
jgi:uncharacterized ferritin-like protein (DUF455 family)